MLQPTVVLLDRYRIDDLLGSGGMGAVYRAFDQRLKCPVAIKENREVAEPGPGLPGPSAAQVAEALARSREQFEREAQVLAHLNHPGLPRVTDHFVIPGQGQYLVMDYIKGQDLQTITRQLGKLSEEQVVRLGIEACEILEYLHGQNPPVIHRDIKPANLRLTEEGKLVLVDFGLVKETTGGETTKAARAVTEGFSPLEQYGGNARTDARSDLYSLGATLCALLSGTVPPTATDRAMGTGRPMLPRVATVSTTLRHVLERATQMMPDNRFPTAAMMQEALLGVGWNSDAPRNTEQTPPPTAGQITRVIDPEMTPATGRIDGPRLGTTAWNPLWWIALIAALALGVIFFLLRSRDIVEHGRTVTAMNSPEPATASSDGTSNLPSTLPSTHSVTSNQIKPQAKTSPTPANLPRKQAISPKQAKQDKAIAAASRDSGNTLPNSGIAPPLTSHNSALGFLLVSCDLDCDVWVDEDNSRELGAGQVVRIGVGRGSHVVRAQVKGVAVSWTRQVSVPVGESAVVKAPLTRLAMSGLWSEKYENVTSWASGKYKVDDKVRVSFELAFSDDQPDATTVGARYDKNWVTKHLGQFFNYEGCDGYRPSYCNKTTIWDLKIRFSTASRGSYRLTRPDEYCEQNRESACEREDLKRPGGGVVQSILLHEEECNGRCVGEGFLETGTVTMRSANELVFDPTDGGRQRVYRQSR